MFPSCWILIVLLRCVFTSNKIKKFMFLKKIPLITKEFHKICYASKKSDLANRPDLAGETIKFLRVHLGGSSPYSWVMLGLTSILLQLASRISCPVGPYSVFFCFWGRVKFFAASRRFLRPRNFRRFAAIFYLQAFFAALRRFFLYKKGFEARSLTCG